MANNENISPDYLRTDDKSQTNGQQNNSSQNGNEQQDEQVQMPQPRQTPRTGGSY